MKILHLICSLCAAHLATAVAAHEFWLDPKAYHVAAHAPVAVDLRNGQRFSGITLPYLPNNTARFELSHEGEISSYSGRVGDFPAFSNPGLAEGLLVIVHETTKSRITYDDWEKFVDFAEEKGRPDIPTAHLARALPQTDFTELYSRHVKTLVAIGNARGADRDFAMKTEFIALSNPYDTDFDGTLEVELRLEGAVQPDSRVTVFARSPDGQVTSLHRQTDGAGRLTLLPEPGLTYLLDAVAFAPAPEGSDAVWETYWAALTFSMPE